MQLISRFVSSFVSMLLVGALVLGGTTGCGESNASAARNVNVEEPRLATLQETGERSFSGVIVNGNAKALNIVQVEVALYDAGGLRVGTATIEVEDVPANGRKKFSGGLDTDAGVAKARVRSVAVP